MVLLAPSKTMCLKSKAKKAIRGFQRSALQLFHNKNINLNKIKCLTQNNMENTTEAPNLQHTMEKLETLWNQSSFLCVTI